MEKSAARGNTSPPSQGTPGALYRQSEKYLGGNNTVMKRIALVAILALCVAAPCTLVAQMENHVEVGAFADYYRFDRGNTVNFVGVGGRVGFYVNPFTSIEAEMGYDFARNNTTTCSNCVNTSFVTTKVRPIHGLFGPKFNLGTSKANFFVTGKVGFVNFDNTTPSFAGAIGNVTTSGTRFAAYPGIGVEGFWGPIGLRAEVGDELYFLGGPQNNLRVTFGPHFRF
jgi:Outer membrane protein beta-barrel domain